MTPLLLPKSALQTLLNVLKNMGFACIGPQLRDAAIVYAPLEQVAQLPQGWCDEQQPGQYRLRQHEGELSQAYFAWANGPQALKPLTFTPRELLWSSTPDAQGRLRFSEHRPEPQPTAVLGVRACDLAALHLQDQHFMHQSYADPYYSARRQSLFLIAVDCSHPAETCFCHSTGDGPNASSGFDMALTELPEGFLIRAKSTRALEVMQQLPLREASADEIKAGATQTEQAAQMQSRSLPSRHLKHQLMRNLEHPHWDDIAQRCLSCTNCTLVCPTCFCHSESDHSDFHKLPSSEHYRQWDSCFNLSHSYMHSFVLRGPTVLRYRQWLLHKLGTWHEQYGRSGCVGCGRCISWCPAAIDLTAEVKTLCEPGVSS